MLYKPTFWITFLLVSLLSALGTYYYFPKAFPIVHLDLTMSRPQAIDAAAQLAKKLQLGPTDARHAASFVTDELTKTFIELDAGGKKAFVAMMENNLYQPYTWQVRHFKQFDANESTLRFTPDGTPYGFIEIIPEDIPGAKLSASKAKNIAEQFAVSEPWSISLDAYKLVESAQETRISGRIDHIFIYERTQKQIGKGYYRLRISVTGDKVTELTHVVKVPESFTRRYAQMRSANSNIAYAAKLALYVLYILGGCFFGLLYVFRKHWVLWRMPLYCALFVAGVTSLQHINSLPLSWMHYNTAHSITGFLLNFFLMLIVEFIYWLFILFISFMAAESLTRKAFGNQIQLWKVWEPQVANSFAILGRTIGGFLIMPVMFFYDVLFFIYTTKYFGWWNPSDALFNPDILASYLPWWQAIVVSLRAGFWEECLFRAVPLASAALLGNRFGKRNWWIAGAFILQAVIFGAAHANYPALPSYARLIELLVVSAIFGAVYLMFGLLPAIIAHFAYDVVWFSIPIFVSTASFAWLNQSIIVLVTLTPLWIVLYFRKKTDLWHTLSEKFLNRSWHPQEPNKTVADTSFTPQSITLPTTISYSLLSIGALGLLVWVFTTEFKNDALKFSTRRAQIFSTAQKVLEKKKVNPTEWYPLVSPLRNYDDNDAHGTQQRFIWQQEGPDLYQSLLGNYIVPPYWLARYVKFNGQLMDRAEEHRVYLKPDGSLYRYQHILPETQKGKKLPEQDARAIAFAKIFQQYNLTPENLKEISAVVNKHPDRLDWAFTFADKNIHLKEGEARIEVIIGSDQVLDARQYIHVPEQWRRTDQNNELIAHVIKQFCALLIYLFMLFGTFYAAMHWKMKIPYRMLIPYFIIFTIIYLFEYMNSWPLIVSQFNTSQPFTDQLFRSFGIQPISLLIRAAMFALLLSFVNSWKPLYFASRNWVTMAAALSIGALFAGLQSLGMWLLPSVHPTWANYTLLGLYLPINAGINSNFVHYVSLTMLFMLLVIILDTISDYFNKRRQITSLLIIGFGFMLAGLGFSNNIPLLLTEGFMFSSILLGAYIFFFRFCYAYIPFATAAFVGLQIMQQAMFNAHPYALIVPAGSITVISLVSWFWNKRISNEGSN